MLYQALQENSLKRSATTVNSGGGFLNWFGGSSTKNGTPVNNTTALTLSAFYNGVTILCNDYAKLPKAVFCKKEDDRIKKLDHALHYLISKKPNQYMAAFNFDAAMMQYAILKGNAYAEIERNAFTGKIEAIQLIDQSKTPVTVKKFDNKLWYYFDNRVLSSEDIIHVPGFSFNGITGVGVVTHAAKSLGVALESQEFASEYYASKGIGTGVVTSTKQMDNDAKTRYGNALSNSLSNKNPFKVAVVDEAGSFQHIKLTPQESLFLETNKHAIEEVARFLNIPPHKLKSTENSNYSNMESQNISHVADSILPWKIKFEQEYSYKCFSKSEKAAGYEVIYNVESLLQSDKKTQASWFSTLIFTGVMTRNEVRSKLNMNQLEGLNEPLTPVNMETLEQIQKKLKALEDE